MRKSYGDHRGIRGKAPRKVLSLWREGAGVYMHPYSLKQDAIWIRWADGTLSQLWKGSLPPQHSQEYQAVLRGVNMAISKRQSATGGNLLTRAWEGCPISKQWPTLAAFLSDPIYDDGTARQPGSMTMFLSAEGNLRICLNDKDTGECCFVSGNSISEVWSRADAGLGEGSLDWRTSRAQKKGR